MIKNLELELSGVQSLSTQEMKSVEGGAILAVIVAVLYLAGTVAAAYQGRNPTTGAKL